MSPQPRRSARLSQLHPQRSSDTSVSSSPSSRSSSESVSAFPSPTSSLSQQQDQFRLQFQASFLGVPQQFSAPLPSPSTNDLDPFFSHLGAQQNLYQMSQPQTNSQQNANQSLQQHNRMTSDQTQQNQAAQHHNSISQSQRSDGQARGNQGQLPPDFLAEAARRAQIACLMRDMGDVTL